MKSLNVFDDKKHYQAVTRMLTEFNYHRFKKSLDPNSLRGTSWHLDHMLSVSNGYRDALKPEIVAHPANLEMLEADLNMKKGKKNSIDLPALKKQIKIWESIHGVIQYDICEVILFLNAFKEQKKAMSRRARKYKIT